MDGASPETREACRMAVEALKVCEALEEMLLQEEALDFYYDKGKYGVMTEAANLGVDNPSLSAAILDARAKL